MYRTDYQFEWYYRTTNVRVCIFQLIKLFIIALPIVGCKVNTIENTAILNVNIVDVVDGSILPSDAVLIQDGIIIKIDESERIRETAASSKSYQVIDGDGGYLIPGLFDLHIHNRGATDQVLQVYLLNGITTVRNMNGSDGGKDHISIGKQIASGARSGPRYYSSTPFVTGSFRESDVEDFIKESKETGYHGLKIHDNIPVDTYNKIIEYSNSVGLPVYGHAQRDKDLAQSLRMLEIVHIEEFVYLIEQSERTSDYLNQVIADVKQSGVWICPTLMIYACHIDYYKKTFFDSLSSIPFIEFVDNQQYELYTSERNPYRQNLRRQALYDYARTNYGVELESEDQAVDFVVSETSKNLEFMKELLLQMIQEDIPLITGSDSFGLLPHGFGLHLELELWQNAGVHPSLILKSATYNSANYMKLDNGEISVGKMADLVLLKENPLDDIKATQSISGIYFKGQFYDSTYIESKLQTLKFRTLD